MRAVQKVLFVVVTFGSLNGCICIPLAGSGSSSRKRPNIDPVPTSAPTSTGISPTPTAITNGSTAGAAPPGKKDLGYYVYPDRGTPASSFRVNFRSPDVPPRDFSIAYGATQEAIQKGDGAISDMARRTHYKELSGGRWTWDPPQGCEGKQAFGCIWGHAASIDRESVRALASRFAREANNDTMKAAQLAISYVQNLIYELPKTYFGFVAPSRTAAIGRADCDSRSMLGVVLLQHLGVDAVMFQSSAHTHAMFGVNLPATGTFKTMNGKRYYFVEATAPRPIGDLSSSNRYPDDWMIVPLKVQAK